MIEKVEGRYCFVAHKSYTKVKFLCPHSFIVSVFVYIVSITAFALQGQI